MNKLLILPLLLFLGAVLASDETDREFSRRKTVVDVESLEIAGVLSNTKALDFDPWLNVFINKDWQLLHTSKSEFFYCVIFRSSHHVIIWFTDRKESLKQTSIRGLLKRLGSLSEKPNR